MIKALEKLRDAIIASVTTPKLACAHVRSGKAPAAYRMTVHDLGGGRSDKVVATLCRACLSATWCSIRVPPVDLQLSEAGQ